MINPWHELPVSPPFVLPQDRAAVEDHNNRVSERHRFHLDVLPEPYLGNPNADVLLLNGNPGFAESAVAQHANPTFAAACRANLVHSYETYPLYLLDPAFKDSGGGRWWRSRLRKLLEVLPLEVVASRVLVVELLPYHSVSFSRPRRRISSQEYSNHLVRQFLARGGPAIWIRGRWQDEVPEVKGYHSLYRTRIPIVAHISPRNCPEGYKAIIQTLSQPAAADRRSAEGGNPLGDNRVSEIRDALHRLGCSSSISDVVISAASAVRAQRFPTTARNYVAVVPEDGAQIALYAERRVMGIALQHEHARRYGEAAGVRVQQKPAVSYLRPTAVELERPEVAQAMKNAAIDALDFCRDRFVAARATGRDVRRPDPGICVRCNIQLLPGGRCGTCDE